MKTKLSKEEVKKVYRSGFREDQKLLEKLFGKEAFEIDPIKEIQDFDDVLRLNKITRKEWVLRAYNLQGDEKAYFALKLIAKAYNQGRVSYLGDEVDPKYLPRFYVKYLRSGFAAAFEVPTQVEAVSGAHLGFRKRQHAVDAAEKFAEVYKEFLIGYY